MLHIRKTIIRSSKLYKPSKSKYHTYKNIIFDLYDTLLFPSNNISFDTQAYLDTFNNIGYSVKDNKKLVNIIQKYKNNSQYAQLYDIISDPYMKPFSKYITNNIYLENIYKMFLSNQYNLLENHNYYTIDRELYSTICTLRKYGIQNIYVISKYDWIITNHLMYALHNKDIKITNSVCNYDILRTDTDTHIDVLIDKFNIQPSNTILVSNNIYDIINAHKNKIYSIGLSTFTSPIKLYHNGADSVIDNICQIPYVLDKIDKEF